jgi:adenylate cyclase
MSDLIAQGEEPQQRWRRTVPEGETLVLGRSAGVWAVPWDQHISRRHVELDFDGRRLRVSCLGEARNPVFYRGKEAQSFQLGHGEHFVIGNTTFTLSDQRVDVASDSPHPAQRQTFSSQFLRRITFRNPDHRIEILSRLVPVISEAAGDAQLRVRLVGMLLAGVPRADTAAIVAVENTADTGETSGKFTARVEVLYWDQRLDSGGDFCPSRRLIVEAFRQQQSVLHIWSESAATQPKSDNQSSNDGASNDGPAFTATGNCDWAFCVPLHGKRSDGEELDANLGQHGQWGLYLAGRFQVDLPNTPSTGDPQDVREDLKFTELVAATLNSFRRIRRLERQHANLSQFFSPVVVDTLAADTLAIGTADSEGRNHPLAPRETTVSVLFCDLRGFSRQSEQHADDLMGLLQRVSRALGVMTHQILDAGGVVGDFQGDAAMGFWGWPLPESDDITRVCRAALAIRREFQAAAADPDSPLAAFQAGIGIATGRAVAGKIGTIDQVKVTVFGPVVNLASRLEGMTKIIRAPILLDETTARLIAEQVPREKARIRRLAIVRPFGLDTSLEVSELLPPESEYPQLTDQHLTHYEAALDAFLARRWPDALRLLHRLPTDDLVTDFLTVYIARHNRTPPTGWDGVIALESK